MSWNLDFKSVNLVFIFNFNYKFNILFKKCPVLHPFILDLSILHELTFLHVEVLKIVLLVTSTNIVIKLYGWSGN